MGTFISHSSEQTQQLGEAWGRIAESGQIIALSGDLGAGKTQIVKGLARGLGCPERVHSPTFNLVNIYLGGRLTLYHLDLYRLETPQQIIAAGLEDYLRPAGVAVIEWAERLFRAQTPAEALAEHVPPVFKPLRWVQISTLGETERRLVYEDSCV